jgi:hypothetical protein
MDTNSNLLATLLGDENSGAASSEASAAEVARPAAVVATEAPAKSQERPPTAPVELRQAPIVDPVDAIKRIADPDQRAKALLALAHASGGGARFEDGLTIVSNGKLWHALVAQMLRDRGPIMKLLPNSFISSSPEDKTEGVVLDEPPTPHADVIFNGTQQTANTKVTAGSSATTTITAGTGQYAA